MQFFLDTANIEQIRKYHRIGLVDGVTTSPALIALEDKKASVIIAEICNLVEGPVNVEVISTDIEGIVQEARALSNLHPNIVVKIPAIRPGFEAMKTIVQASIKVNVTMVYTANQALIAAKLGASYISPFIGRLDASSTNGSDLVREIVRIIKNFQLNTEVIAASMRSAIYVKEAALAGAHIATIPPNILEQMMVSELTEVSLQGFLEQWNKLAEGKRDLFKVEAGHQRSEREQDYRYS